jgi:hypothetical protein
MMPKLQFQSLSHAQVVKFCPPSRNFPTWNSISRKEVPSFFLEDKHNAILSNIPSQRCNASTPFVVIHAVAQLDGSWSNQRHLLPYFILIWLIYPSEVSHWSILFVIHSFTHNSFIHSFIPSPPSKFSHCFSKLKEAMNTLSTFQKTSHWKDISTWTVFLVDHFWVVFVCKLDSCNSPVVFSPDERSITINVGLDS